MAGKVQGGRSRHKRPLDESTDSGGDQQQMLDGKNRTSASPNSLAPALCVEHSENSVNSNEENALLPTPAFEAEELQHHHHQQQQEQQESEDTDWCSFFCSNNAYVFGSDDEFLQASIDDQPYLQPQQQQTSSPREPSVTPRLNSVRKPPPSEFGSGAVHSTFSPGSRSSKSIGTLEIAKAARPGHDRYQHLMAGVSVLSQLWQTHGSAPDVIMATNKTAARALNEFLSELDYSDNREEGLMLCTMTLQIVVDLYSEVFESSKQLEQENSWNPKPPAATTLPVFGFGNFEIDNSSQRKLFNQMILKEVETALKLWKRIWAAMDNTHSLDSYSSGGICERSFLQIRNKLRHIMCDIDI
ncbi:hypothetical protein BP6252_07510 [Coleophoma cylindrospora]|uniref:Uncharacterized protein n=1 Tax=Coleophoma cylindrospora TaxID=1849047 RepID=A0A3D8RA68_9HELO|nr:hypothetical protein BP6252_07510 [Coleophoma cylindrospora]